VYTDQCRTLTKLKHWRRAGSDSRPRPLTRCHRCHCQQRRRSTVTPGRCGRRRSATPRRTEDRNTTSGVLTPTLTADVDHWRLFSGWNRPDESASDDLYHRPASPSSRATCVHQHSQWYHLLRRSRTKLNYEGQFRLVAWHSGRTSVCDRQTFPALRSICIWRVTTYVGKPSLQSLTRTHQEMR